MPEEMYPVILQDRRKLNVQEKSAKRSIPLRSEESVD
jgi:hypothetical protein